MSQLIHTIAELPLSSGSSLFNTLYRASPQLVRRAPQHDDTARWYQHSINSIAYRFAQPITLTPYASANACSARCHFCSETLRPKHGGVAAAALRPQENYFEDLSAALHALGELPISFSLSGLEATDNAAWFLRLLSTLIDAEKHGLRVQERVLYSNGAGFAHQDSSKLLASLKAFKLSWLELSRHHFSEEKNQAIMRFREHETIANNAVFEKVANTISNNFPLKMVCIIQRDGIDTAEKLQLYLKWAISCGASSVIFRELSKFDDYYRVTRSQQYIEKARVSLEDLLSECIKAQLWLDDMHITHMTEGYYFWNVKFQHRDGVDVVFESSDYTAMHKKHQSGDIYKLVYFANGQLCAGWEPNRDILWQHENG
jgi:hypothetical protein